MANITDLAEPPSPNDKEVLVPASRAEWRRWLADNADRDEGLWVVYRKKSSDVTGPDYDDLVEESLCFGWIDSLARGVDEYRTIQWFSPRRKGGIWSKLNKERIERLEAQGLMAERGQMVIDQAIADGSWSQTDQVDALIVPPDLQEALDAKPRARAAYDSLSDSRKRQYLWQVYSAKRAATRSKRIEATVQELSAGT